MRRAAARVDANQHLIVNALRQAGCTVQCLSAVGKGCPDLLVGYDGKNYLLEVKDGSKKPSARRLTEHQWEWIPAWKGQVAVVKSVEEACSIVGVEWPLKNLVEDNTEIDPPMPTQPQRKARAVKSLIG